MPVGGSIKAFLFEDFTFANDGGELTPSQNGPFTLPSNATASVTSGAASVTIVVEDDDEEFDDGFQDDNDGVLNQILANDVSFSNAAGDTVSVDAGSVLEVEFTLTATPQGGGDSVDLLFVAAGPGENQGDITFIVTTGPLDPNVTYDIAFKNDGGGTPYGALEDGVVDGEDFGEVMGPGYDDSNGPTDGGGDQIDGDDGVNDVIEGNGGDDTINAGLGSDTVDGGVGNDSIEGGTGNDEIDGGSGADRIDAGDGTDTVQGGAGNDTITGGGDNDNLRGGDDRDTLIIDQLGTSGVNNTTADGGSGGDDFDTLDITPLLDDGWQVVNFVRNPETNGEPGFNGQIQLQRGSETANINYTDIEDLIVCFTPGARIATPSGTRPVEDLCPGDKVFTRDNGVREIRWVGRRDLDAVGLAKMPKFQPILIREGALGADMPDRDMLVSPNHRMLLANELAEVLFGEREVLVAAKHLVSLDGVDRARVNSVSYIHLLFDHHEVILADAAWSESFQPGDYSMRGVGQDSRNEILALFPELASQAGLNGYNAARMSLKAHEVKVLIEATRS